ncbi:MAG: hypothetical protein CMJ13_04630 [Pelagibacterales bacterium]|nr:hypothetical protein [Pelagibacterales bacterium]
MVLLIEKDRGWKSTKIKNIKVYFSGKIDPKILEDLVIKLKNKSSNLTTKQIKSDLIKFKGNFSIIIMLNKNYLLAVVDRVKSIPIFMAKTEKSLFLGNYAPSLIKTLANKKIDHNSLLSFKMSGYCIGRNTLYKNLFQLLPGEACLIRNKSLKYISYHSFIKKDKIFTDSKEKLSKKLAKMTLSIFEEIIKNNKSKKIVVPLSGGYDSRLIASALYHLNARDVVCFSYGKKNNFEAKVAREISSKLNFPWHFVELNNKKQSQNFKSKMYKDYTIYSDTLGSWSYIQDLFAIKELLEKKVINKNSVIINGNTGDFITGGHLPGYDRKLKDKKSRLNLIFKYISSKHFSLWENYFSRNQYNLINKLILKSIPKSLLNIGLEEDYKVYEYVEFINRQSNYVIQGQRQYDFLKIAWELPLWHDNYLKFWNKVPFELKYNQDLYKFMLTDNNWGDVWQKIPVNNYHISPKYIKYLRNLFKLFFIFKNRNDWHNFDKKYISYFTELVPYYPYFNYSDIIKEKKIARNALAWHAEDYLKKKDLIL